MPIPSPRLTVSSSLRATYHGLARPRARAKRSLLSTRHTVIARPCDGPVRPRHSCPVGVEADRGQAGWAAEGLTPVHFHPITFMRRSNGHSAPSSYPPEVARSHLSVLRSHLGGDDARQSTAALVLVGCLSDDERSAQAGTEGHGSGQGAVRHDPAQAVQDRSTHHRHRAQDLDLTLEQLSMDRSVAPCVPESRSRFALTRIQLSPITVPPVARWIGVFEDVRFAVFPQPITGDASITCTQTCALFARGCPRQYQSLHESPFSTGSGASSPTR